MDHPKYIVSNQKEESISVQRVYKLFCRVFQSDLGSVGSAPISPATRRSLDDYPIPSTFHLHGGIRRLQRTLSEDNKRRRDSVPTTPTGPNPPGMGMPGASPLGHSTYLICHFDVRN